MLKPTPATAFGLRPSSGIRISDFSCLPATPRQPRAPVNGATTACQRCCYGAALYWCSIGALLVLYCSSIVPLLMAVFCPPPAPSGRDEGAALEHPQLVLPPVHLLPHPDKHLRAFQGHMIPLGLKLPPLLELLHVQLREVNLLSFRRRAHPKKGIQVVLVRSRVQRRPAVHHDVLQRRASVPPDLLRNLELEDRPPLAFLDREPFHQFLAELGRRQRRRIQQWLSPTGRQHPVQLKKEQSAVQLAGLRHVGPAVDLQRQPPPSHALVLPQPIPQPGQICHIPPRPQLGNRARVFGRNPLAVILAKTVAAGDCVAQGAALVLLLSFHICTPLPTPASLTLGPRPAA